MRTCAPCVESARGVCREVHSLAVESRDVVMDGAGPLMLQAAAPAWCAHVRNER